jgi:hypothetical protein
MTSRKGILEILMEHMDRRDVYVSDTSGKAAYMFKLLIQALNEERFETGYPALHAAVRDLKSAIEKMMHNVREEAAIEEYIKLWESQGETARSYLEHDLARAEGLRHLRQQLNAECKAASLYVLRLLPHAKPLIASLLADAVPI